MVFPKARRTRYEGQAEPGPGAQTFQQAIPANQPVPEPWRLQLRRDEDRSIGVHRWLSCLREP